MRLKMLYLIADVVLYPLIYYVIRYRRRVVRKNLSLSFPQLSKKELLALEKKFYHHFCNIIVEICYCRHMSEEEVLNRVKISNIEQHNELCTRYGGSLAMLAHLGCWEWMISVQLHVAPAGIRQCNVYRELKNKTVDRLMNSLRQRYGAYNCEKQRLLRDMIEHRKACQPVIYGMLSDQKPSPNNMHFWTMFLNQETSFLNGSEVLSRKFHYPVFYLHITSPKRGYYNGEFRLLAEDPAALSEYELTERYVRMLEENIIEAPHLWLWTHNRWKWSKKDIPEGLKTNLQ